MSEDQDVSESLNDAASDLYFHVREPFSETDQVKVFSSYMCAEKPDLSQMDIEEREIHRKRHFAKKGIDLVSGEKVDPRHDAEDCIVEERVQIAREVVEEIMTDEHVQELADHVYANIHDKEDKQVFLLRNSVAEGGQVSYNFLSPTYDHMLITALTKALDEKHPDHGITFEMETAIRLNNTKRVYSDPAQRLARQAYMDTVDLEKMRGKNIIIADEHVQSGAMVMTIYSLLKKMGDDTNILGVTSLTCHPTIQDLHCSQEVNNVMAEYLSDTDKDAIEDTLGRVGLSYDTLTAREGLYVLALVLDGQNPEQAYRFAMLEDHLSQGKAVIEGVEDDLYLALRSPPLDVEEFDKKISEILTERQGTFYVHASQVDMSEDASSDVSDEELAGLRV